MSRDCERAELAALHDLELSHAGLTRERDLLDAPEWISHGLAAKGRYGFRNGLERNDPSVEPGSLSQNARILAVVRADVENAVNFQ